MNGSEFLGAVERHLAPVLEPLGFKSVSSVSGRLYSAEYLSAGHVVSVSLEPGDDYFLVIVFTVTSGGRSNIDDRDVSPRLPDLNRRFLSDDDGPRLKELRRPVATDDPIEKLIQHAAAELAVVLPRYIASRQPRS